jgi:hypothetical protein
MRYFLIATLAAGGALAASVTVPANAGPLPSITAPQAGEATVENVAMLRRQWRRGYIVPPAVVAAPTVVVPGAPAIVYRPAGHCGEFRYWDGGGCVDARYVERHFK